MRRAVPLTLHSPGYMLCYPSLALEFTVIYVLSKKEEGQGEAESSSLHHALDRFEVIHF